MRRLGWARLLAFVLIVENVYLAYPSIRDFALNVEEGPATRGRMVAAELGCFNCHGPEGRGNVPNPGSKFETVPGFTEQTLMMFVKGDGELREYILEGAPHRRRSSASYQEQMQQQAIQMPAFRDWISDSDVDALVAYLRQVSGMLRPQAPQAVRGEQLAAQLGCFTCHGEMGMGGRPNPGSLKGYIPGFLGEDFRELVRDDQELLTWLREGSLPRIAEHGLGRRFFERQRIKMPAYGRFLPAEDLQALAAYVRWLSEGSWRDQPLSP
jgi:mono/diheme cytochrome c family protein